MSMTLPLRIERKIARIPMGGCWIWTASGDRYGTVYFDGRNRRAHRVVYGILVGQVPEGMELLHRCDVGLCVNPHHLFIGTHADNMADMVRKGRARAPIGDAHWTRSDGERALQIARLNIARTHAPGADNNNAKLTHSLVAQMRATYSAAPGQTMAQLGRQFGVGRETARKVIKEIAWKS